MDKDMTESEKQIGLLFTAELHFRLASAVRLATSGTQPIDLPIPWTHGNHSVVSGKSRFDRIRRISPPIFFYVLCRICWPLR